MTFVCDFQHFYLLLSYIIHILVHACVYSLYASSTQPARNLIEMPILRFESSSLGARTHQYTNIAHREQNAVCNAIDWTKEK